MLGHDCGKKQRQQYRNRHRQRAESQTQALIVHWWCDPEKERAFESSVD